MIAFPQVKPLQMPDCSGKKQEQSVVPIFPSPTRTTNVAQGSHQLLEHLSLFSGWEILYEAVASDDEEETWAVEVTVYAPKTRLP